MEQFRSEISALCQTHINYVEDPKWDYAYSKFWNVLSHELFRGDGYYGVPSMFSMWLQQILVQIVDEQLNFDELVDFISTGGGSIGDRWLDEQMNAIESSVAMALLGGRL